MKIIDGIGPSAAGVLIESDGPNVVVHLGMREITMTRHKACELAHALIVEASVIEAKAEETNPQ